MNIKNNNKGFSLIELSIVLIIIGLLVSGITGGASLIKSAELRSIMTEARGYKMAVNAYYTSQDALPGDDDNVSNGTNNVAVDTGDGDGKIEAVGATSNEGMEAWNDMSFNNIGILDIAPVEILEVKSEDAPALRLEDMGESKYKNAGWTFDYATTGVDVGNNSTANDTEVSINSNVLIFTAPTETMESTTEIIPTAILTYSEALAIDKKMDNGAHNTGSVYGGLGSCATDEAGDVCSLYIKLGL